ncbi:MAG: hypothetical protein ACTSU4_04815 [Promethearchaeota archaeon]
MSRYLNKFEFQPTKVEINYLEGEPLKLTEKFSFYHNKNFFRNKITPLQILMKNYVKTPLTAAGIRDSYLDEKYTQKYLIVIFTDNETIKKTNEILASKETLPISPSCYYMESTAEYFLLLARDLDGLKYGLQTMELFLKQVLDHYFKQQNFDDYIKIRPFQLKACQPLKEP